MTRQRRIILDVLAGSKAHPTADEVYQAVRRQMPRISLATVYRNLDLLAGEGRIGRLRLGEGPARYDGHAGDHHHVRCVRCGRVDDVPAGFCDIRPAELDRSTGYELVDCRVEISGLCPACQRKEPTDQRSLSREQRDQRQATVDIPHEQGEDDRCET